MNKDRKKDEKQFNTLLQNQHLIKALEVSGLNAKKANLKRKSFLNKTLA